jgi:hypothetical protein
MAREKSDLTKDPEFQRVVQRFPDKRTAAAQAYREKEEESQAEDE